MEADVQNRDPLKGPITLEDSDLSADELDIAKGIEDGSIRTLELNPDTGEMEEVDF